MKQTMASRFQLALTVMLVVLAVAGLVSCGKKAAHVDAPSGVEDDIFPRTYPDTDTDPKP